MAERVCVDCGEVKRIAAKGQCVKCYDRVRMARLRAERGESPPRQYTCADCGADGTVETHSSHPPKRCPACTTAHTRELRRRSYQASSDGSRARDRTRRAATKARLLANGLPNGEKTCPSCGQLRPFSEFPVAWTKVNGRHSYYCQDCYREQDRRRRREQRETYVGYTRKWYEANTLVARLVKYKTNVDGYLEMLHAQSYACAICEEAPEDPYSLHVDHCHDSGVVRGLLCVNCNTAIGRLGEDPERIRRAALYVETTGRMSTPVPHTQPERRAAARLHSPRSPICARPQHVVPRSLVEPMWTPLSA